MDAPEISVYGEAKGEYTRQLCVFLTPCLESYMLEVLDEAKVQSTSPQKNLWHFQSLLQAIPDWNQDKVIRETEKIQKDCRCDYLEELLTAVFIAHTKVLSAIRLTTKQKKLQITIPKLEHFLHRVLSECARSLWTNAYLFAESNSIEKQKNLRQVAGLIQEAILQAIRGLLPVKSILREYLHEDDDEVETPAASHAEEKEENEEKVEEVEEKPVEDKPSDEKPSDEKPSDEKPSDEKPVEEKPVEEEKPQILDLSGAIQPPMIIIDTKPSFKFNQGHIIFDSDNLEANEIQDLPFAEAELRREDEDDEDDEYAPESLNITDEILPMDAEEIIA